MDTKAIEKAKSQFKDIVTRELERIEMMKQEREFVEYNSLEKIKIGIASGDGIGPYICEETKKVLNHLLKDEINSGKIELIDIEGLTIENRAKQEKALPEDVLEQIKECHLILKGPTTTPRAGDGWPNIESANVAIRRSLDLFAGVRPVKVQEKNINWVFFRENTEDLYILGDEGINITDELAIDFKSITLEGSTRIIRSAFEYAKNNGRKRVTAVTKANVVKSTDGKFLKTAQQIAKEYPEIEFDDWYIDIMAAKLIDPVRQSDFDVIVLPNLYGDILTDLAAQIQGGVGTAGSANIGKRHAMFEAIHGSATRMVEAGRTQYADPSSLMRASIMLLRHLGFQDKAKKLERALDICTQYKKNIIPNGQPDGPTSKEFTSYLIETIDKPDLTKY